MPHYFSTKPFIMKQIGYLIIVTSLFVSCGSNTHIQKSWRDPEVTVDMSKLNKVLVVALLKNEANRRAVEDELASKLKGKGVASYNYLSQSIREENESEIQQKLKAENFDGMIIMRLADVDKDIKYVPGTFSTFPSYYGRPWKYYWNSRNSFYQPGYYETTKKFTVETNVYSLIRDKLIWSGLTNTYNPENTERLMHSVANEVFTKMKKEGFIVNN